MFPPLNKVEALSDRAESDAEGDEAKLLFFMQRRTWLEEAADAFRAVKSLQHMKVTTQING